MRGCCARGRSLPLFCPPSIAAQTRRVVAPRSCWRPGRSGGRPTAPSWRPWARRWVALVPAVCAGRRQPSSGGGSGSGLGLERQPSAAGRGAGPGAAAFWPAARVLPRDGQGGRPGYVLWARAHGQRLSSFPPATPRSSTPPPAAPTSPRATARSCRCRWGDGAGRRHGAAGRGLARRAPAVRAGLVAADIPPELRSPTRCPKNPGAPPPPLQVHYQERFSAAGRTRWAVRGLARWRWRGARAPKRPSRPSWLVHTHATHTNARAHTHTHTHTHAHAHTHNTQHFTPTLTHLPPPRPPQRLLPEARGPPEGRRRAGGAPGGPPAAADV
jgi:hypothetical protein